MILSDDFGQQFTGFCFTEKWLGFNPTFTLRQTTDYFGDVSRPLSMTVEWIPNTPNH